MNPRLKRIHATISAKKLDAIILFSPVNISYLLNFESREACLLISKKENIYFTDSRYTQECKLFLKKNAKLQELKGSRNNCIIGACLKLGLKRLGFEEKHLSFNEYKNIKKLCAKKIKLMPINNLVEEIRQIKEPQEIKIIKKAIKITIKAIRYIKKFIKPGVRELEIVAELERFIRYQGAFGAAFNIIVACGPNSCFPHHLPSQRKIRYNEPVLIDIGVDYHGYKSDLTRVFFLGKIDTLTQKVYATVKTANDLAVKKIRPGINANVIDAVARNYIAKAGFGKYFTHSLGHGVGMEVHESPGISSKAKEKLKTGMVFTVEPAIYLSEKFGIRLEDMVLVTKNGCEVLSGALHK